MAILHPETAHGFECDSTFGTRIDGSVVKWWPTRTAARDAARSIGWPMKSVWPVWTRFQCGYAINQQCEGFLTKAGFAALLESRGQAEED